MRYQIIVYQTLAEASTPSTCIYIAGLIIGYDQQPRWFCSGGTADKARERMEGFWEIEQKAHGIKPAPKPPAPSPAVDVEDPGDVV